MKKVLVIHECGVYDENGKEIPLKAEVTTMTLSESQSRKLSDLFNKIKEVKNE